MPRWFLLLFLFSLNPAAHAANQFACESIEEGYEPHVVFSFSDELQVSDGEDAMLSDPRETAIKMNVWYGDPLLLRGMGKFHADGTNMGLRDQAGKEVGSLELLPSRRANEYEGLLRLEGVADGNEVELRCRSRQ